MESSEYHIEGIFQGVNFLWMLKISNIHGQKFVVHTVILTFVSKYFMVIFPTTKKTKFFTYQKMPTIWYVWTLGTHAHTCVCTHIHTAHVYVYMCVLMHV
jgi:hypothetical protein